MTTSRQPFITLLLAFFAVATLLGLLTQIADSAVAPTRLVGAEDGALRAADSSSNRHRTEYPGRPVLLVQNGAPMAQLVLSPTSTNSVEGSADRAAAALLQEWIELITDARLPIVTAHTAGVPIYVGRAAVEAGLTVDDLDSASNEALRIRVAGDTIYLSGQTGNSRIKAAAVLLEELGCRWFMEGDLGKVYPRQQTLRVPQMEITDQPGFVYRRIWGGEGWAQETLWKIWNGAGGLALSMEHAWGEISEADYENHPEWFRMDSDGNRVLGPWLNTGNPEMRAAFTDRLIAGMSAGEHPSISPPDNYREDHSPASARYDDPGLIEPSSSRVSMSNRFLHFANDVAARVGAAFPRSILNFYSYSDYSLPPTRLGQLEPNICVWIAPIRFSRFHRIGSPNSPSRQQLERNINGWARVASRLGYRTYNFNLAESMTPYSKVSTWTHDIPYLKTRNFIGMSIESFPTWDLSIPTIYLSIRLAYDPLGDAAELLQDFYRNFYGVAAEPMRDYWQLVDNAWQGLKTESGSIYSLHLVFTPEHLDRLDRHLSRAERLVAGQSSLEDRVRMARIGYQHAADFVALREALQGGQIDAAFETYRQWSDRVRSSIEAGTGHTYNERYLRRFVGRTVTSLHDALHPADEDERRLVTVVPDSMDLAYQADLQRAQVSDEPLKTRVNPSRWQPVRTFGATLEQQGKRDRFEVMWYRTTVTLSARRDRDYWIASAPIDGDASLWVNGTPLTGDESPQVFPALRPFLADISGLIRSGTNRLAFRVDHRVLRELSLGGIVGPIYILER